MLTATNDILIQYSNVVGVDNVYADRRSRWLSKTIEPDIRSVLESKLWDHVL